MITRITAYDKRNKQFLHNVSLTDVEQLLQQRHIYLWLDIEQPTGDMFQFLKTGFDFDEMSLEDCQHPRQTPKLETFPEYHFWIVHGIQAPSDLAVSELLELHAFLGDRFLVTLHNKPIASIELVMKQCHDNHSRLTSGTAYLAYSILDRFIDQYMPVLDYFDEKLGHLEGNLTHTQLSANQAKHYLKLSKQILTLRRSAVKNQEVFYQLSHSHLKFIDPDEARLFKDIYDHVLRVVDMSEYYQQALRSILDIHLSVNGNRANQVAQFLTIIATIMLPLSVITGIYGMNFKHMPFLESPYGFWGIVCFMALLSLWMVRYFKRQGWL